MEEPLSIETRRAEAAGFRFHRIHPQLGFGTASDRFAAWIGQVYPEHRWHDRVEERKRTMGGASFVERQLPIASVQDYFEHFDVLELDFTFYRPLIEEDGRPGSNYHVLREYAEFAPADARFLLKAPQAFSARILRQGRTFVPNPHYLDARGYDERFVRPAVALLGERLAGVLFQQEYSRRRESPEPEAFAAEIDAFLRAAPNHPTLHLEIRSAHLHSPALFDALHAHGAGFLFSHWTWLPPLKAQWDRLGGTAEAAFTAADGSAVVRLMNPRDVSHADAYRLAYPFDRAVPELSETPDARRMIDETVALMYQAVENDRTLTVIANNRAWGNSPALAQAVANRFLDFAARRGQ